MSNCCYTDEIFLRISLCNSIAFIFSIYLQPINDKHEIFRNHIIHRRTVADSDALYWYARAKLRQQNRDGSAAFAFGGYWFVFAFLYLSLLPELCTSPYDVVYTRLQYPTGASLSHHFSGRSERFQLRFIQAAPRLKPGAPHALFHWSEHRAVVASPLLLHSGNNCSRLCTHRLRYCIVI